MAQRKDGIETKGRLLESACRCFAERGFHDTRVTDICKQAGANVAAVNYYFESKQELYSQAWKYAFDNAQKVFPYNGGLGSDAEPEERLRAFIRSLLHRTLNSGRLGYTGKFLLREMSQPSEIAKEIKRQTIEPLRKHVIEVVHNILGPEVDEEQARWCTFSIISQCLMIGSRGGAFPYVLQGESITDEFIERLASHIAEFSLGGLRSLRQGNCDHIQSGLRLHAQSARGAHA